MKGLIVALLISVWAAGMVTAMRVLHERRSPEGTVSWVFALLGLPFLAVPVYWMLGSHRHQDYRISLREATGRAFGRHPLENFHRRFPPNHGRAYPSLAALTPYPFLTGNRVELLVDGNDAFAAIEGALQGAQRCVLAEFYTIARDATGRRFLELLIEASARGVRVFLLYDAWGSFALDRKEVGNLRRHGVEARAFHFGRWGLARPKLNFRNHRKILVVDGTVAFFGGMNVSDTYRGRHPRLRPWRDTQVRLEGPSALFFQSIFATDWYCTTGQRIDELQWDPPETCGEAECTVLPTGPAQERDEGTMLVHELARRADRRLWISSPYLIPGGAVLAALRAAALRGVDVCVLTSGMRDHHTTFRAGFFFARELRDAGIRVFRLNSGFLHQKAILVDNSIAALGSMNLDHRSLHLNFEVTAIFVDPGTVEAVYKMLRRDLAQARDSAGEWKAMTSLGRLMACGARLFGPLL